MNAALFGLAWAGVVLGASYRHRPLQRRVPAPPSRPEPGWRAVEVVGRWLLRNGQRVGLLAPCGVRVAKHRVRSFAGVGQGDADAGGHESPSPAPEGPRARWVGLVAIAAVTTAAAAPVLVPVVAFGAWAVPKLRARRQQRRHLARLEAALPEVVDLLVLAVGAGATVSHAVAAAGRRGVGPLAAELRRITEEVRRGGRIADALDELPSRTSEAIRPLSAALASSERYGAPLATALERLGDDVRRQRQRRSEEAARKVPVLLLFPLVLCILPAFALLTVAPLVAGALRTLRL